MTICPIKNNLPNKYNKTLIFLGQDRQSNGEHTFNWDFNMLLSWNQTTVYRRMKIKKYPDLKHKIGN